MRLYYNPAFLKRLFFYSIGIGMGTFLVTKINSNKKSTFDYFGDDRVLKSIRNIKNEYSFEYDEAVQTYMVENKIDTNAVNTLLFDGNVILTKANRGKQKCNTFHIEPTEKTAQISIDVKRCDSVATVVKLQITK